MVIELVMISPVSNAMSNMSHTAVSYWLKGKGRIQNEGVENRVLWRT
jgi:hypothetical protein